MTRDFTFILFILCSNFLFGQIEPIEKLEVEQDPVIMDSYDYATGRMKDVPWMFKLSSDNGFRFGFEYKFAYAYSFNINTKWSTSAFSSLTTDNRVSLRRYFNHEDRINQNLQGNNFNGKYLEAGALVNFSTITKSFAQPFVSLGLQSRFLGYGFIDTGIKLDYNIANSNIRIISGFDLGLAFSAKYKLEEVENNRCAVVRCYDEQFYMLKTQISRLLNLSFAKNTYHIGLRPNFELEHRISKVGLTMNHDLWFNFSARKFSNNQSYVIGEAGLRSSIRWYVGKKRRIIKGKTSNNLSGFYLGPIGEIGILEGEYFGDRIVDGEFWSAGFNVGYQTRLLKNLYIHFTTGAMYREYYNAKDYAQLVDIENVIEAFIINPLVIDPMDPIDPMNPLNPIGRVIALKPIGRLVVGYVF